MMATFTSSMPYPMLKRASTRHIEPKSVDQAAFSLNFLNFGVRLAYAYSVFLNPIIVTGQLSFRSNGYTQWFITFILTGQSSGAHLARKWG
jgi:hypothetical protein